MRYGEQARRLTAKLPGTFRAIVHCQPRYSEATPSSENNRKKLLPRKASGLVCILILSTSRGNRTCARDQHPVLVFRPYRWTHDFSHSCQTVEGEIQCQQYAESTSVAALHSPSRRRMHHQSTPFVPKRISESLTTIPVDQIPEIRLTSKFVYPLSNLVTGCIPQSRKQRKELLVESGSGVRFEDDRVEMTERDL